MYELLVLACLVAHPAKCDEFHVQFDHPVDAMGCMYESQPLLAQWASIRPDWMIRRWVCDLPKT